MDRSDQDEKEAGEKTNVGCAEGIKCKATPFAIPIAQSSVKKAINGDFPDLKYSVDVPACGAVECENTPKRDSSLPAYNNYFRPIYHHDFSLWPNIQPEYQKLDQSHWFTMENHFYSTPQGYPYPFDNRAQYFPLRAYFPGYPHVFNAQEFQYFVVVDFEATCDKENYPHPQEIIEFPSVLVNSTTGQLEASFQTYVRPAYRQNLTDFCKELTGIQQIQVDRGVPLSEALFMHDKWLEDKGIKHSNFAIVTWSSWDCRIMLESECRLKSIRKPPYFNRWINLKVPFKELFGGVRCNLKEAVQLAGLMWEGRPHCGLDDARNTARLLALILRRGSRLSITDSLSAATHQPTAPIPLPPYAVPFQPLTEPRIQCFCGVTSSKRMIRKPGPKHGRFFFGCGNWTTARGAVCPYFQWASS